MLSNPLTPSSEPSELFEDINHVVTPDTYMSDYAAHHLPTPPSDSKMGLETLDERLDMEDRLGLDDEDQDMSEGGVPLTMTLSHAEELNTEMDLVDAEVMGPENLVGLFLETQPTVQLEPSFQSPNDPPSPQYSPEEIPQEAPTQAEDIFDHVPIQPASHASDIPITMTGVTDQLQQQLHNGQLLLAGAQEDHEDFGDVAEDPHLAGFNNMEDQANLQLGTFLISWGQSAIHGEEERRRKGPSLLSIERQISQKLKPVERGDLQGERCDIQRLNWMDLGVSRLEARQLRRDTYRNYTNLRINPDWHPPGAKLKDDQNLFRFRRMDFDHHIHLSHFQLRNLIACATRDHIFYAGRSQIMQWNPKTGTPPSEAERPTVAMDLSDPIIQNSPMNGFGGNVQVSTMTVAHDILVAGGWNGEYGLVNLRAHKDTKHTEGLITNNLNSITNHIQVHYSRRSSLPLAAFASNDTGMRILDINTNKFIAEHKYEHPINCSAISPDQRLRVLVGDSQQVLICSADTGDILQSLEGHRDYGFACDWADDGWTVATGNQDKQVKIWDARKWTNNQGLACPVATIAADMAGVRKLKFSPLGSGKRVLVAAEPADNISIIDGETFGSKQTLSFFGEIGGVDFTNNGQDLIVANCDSMRGGLMEFERCGHSDSSLYELDQRETISRHRRRKSGYDWLSSDEKIVAHPKARGTEEHRRRKVASLGVTMGHF